MVSPSLVVQFLFILAIGRIVGKADIAVVHDQMRLTEHRAALTAGIGITQDSGHTFVEAISIRRCNLIFADTDIHPGLTGNISRGCSRGFIVIAYIASPSTAIDVTNRTTFDISRRRSCKGSALAIFGFIVVQHRTTGSSRIEVFVHRTA